MTFSFENMAKYLNQIQAAGRWIRSTSRCTYRALPYEHHRGPWGYGYFGGGRGGMAARCAMHERNGSPWPAGRADGTPRKSDDAAKADAELAAGR